MLRHLSSPFPSGTPGLALLLLRVVLGMLLVVHTGFYLDIPGASPAVWLVGLAALAAGASLLVGFLTPLAAAIAGLGATGVGFSLLPAGSRTLFDSSLPLILAATILVAILLMGPGAFSVDARLFGRREIIIPPLPPSRR